MLPGGLDYQDIYERNATGVCRLDAAGRLIDCNDALAELLGFATRAELLAVAQLDYVNESDGELVLAALRDLGELRTIEAPLRRRDGSVAWVCQNATATTDDTGHVVFDAVMMETSEQREAVQRLEHLSLHDPLTELPNRALFLDRLTVALASARRNQRRIAVLYVDLDHFSNVVERWGQSIAERLLKRVGVRLSDAVRVEDSVARISSDEFALLLTGFGDEETCAIIGQRVLDSIAQPFVFDGHEISIACSAGIAVFPTDGAEPDALLDNSREAMLRAKETGRNSFQFHRNAVSQRAFERALLVGGVRRALQNGEFVLHYQPEVDTRSGRIDCIEALLRWNHPEFGLVEPGRFLPAAEASYLTGAIGEWVLTEACRQAREWEAIGLNGARIAVNLSRQQLEKPHLIDDIDRIFRDAGVSPSILQLEVSERAIPDFDAMLDTLNELKAFGSHLAIDNFGTGRCSLMQLKHIPANTLKIDRGFIQNVPESREDSAIVEAILTMAAGLQRRVVAEGVETREQMAFLHQKRCMEMQGFLFGKPLPAKEMEDTLRIQH
ncbi:MAG: EAL domain-containing protein [Thermoanaerobaculia bacterium]|jgi:diguanylate cyclase (GGDEF)-like protein/PAS domain S-box-containing protein